jgi:hypothetical protein
MDLAVIETGNGGDIQIVGNDLGLVFGIENMPYLAMFGGNPGYPTKSKIEDEQSFDFWGNDLIFKNNPSAQFNSLLEKKLQTVALTSAGRIQIEDIIRKDLAFLSSVAEITVVATIISDDHLNIAISIKQGTRTNIKIINFKKQDDGDFRLSDFNDDFYV